MNKRDFIRAGTAGAAGSLALGAASLAQAQTGPSYNWKMATGWAGGPLMDIGAKAFAERMALLSGGRFKIQTFPGGALGNALKVPETVKNGLAEVGHTWMGYDWGKDQTTVLFGGYAGSFDTERMLHWIYQGGGKELQRKFRDETEGIISIPLFIRTAEVFLHSRKPVKTLADLKGLKLRTAGAWLEMSTRPGRGAGHHRRRRRLPDARARRDRRGRVGHAVGEHLAGLPQDRQVPHRTPAFTSRPRRSSWWSTRRCGPRCRRPTSSWWRWSRSWSPWKAG